MATVAAGAGREQGAGRGEDPPPGVGLEAFAGFLQAHGVLSERLDYAADEGTLQKCAYIAQEGFGLDLGYSYHLHAYGTFAPFIAADFSRLVKRTQRAAAAPMPPQFREGEFLALVSGKGIDWLCVATIVVHERGMYVPGGLRRHVERMSASHNRGLVKGAIRDIDAALGPSRGMEGAGAGGNSAILALMASLSKRLR